MKVAIVGGAGGVGASTAFNLLFMRGEHEVMLVDTRASSITSHLMDFEQVLELAPGCAVRRGDESDVADADVLVMTAAAPLTLNTSRLVYLRDNARIADHVVDLLPPRWPGVLLVVTNPVDPLVCRVWERGDLDRNRVIGYTLNDTLRLRTGIAKALGVPPGSVDAWVLGEHGDACVPLFDRVTVDGRPRALTADEAGTAREYLATWYARHVALDSGRSSTWTSGLGVARMIAALETDGEVPEPWPASVVLDGEYGIAGAAVSVPVVLGVGGVRRILAWELAERDLAALRAAADVVRCAAGAIDA